MEKNINSQSPTLNCLLTVKQWSYEHSYYKIIINYRLLPSCTNTVIKFVALLCNLNTHTQALFNLIIFEFVLILYCMLYYNCGCQKLICSRAWSRMKVSSGNPQARPC